jgi:hypothetical protein
MSLHRAVFARAAAHVPRVVMLSKRDSFDEIASSHCLLEVVAGTSRAACRMSALGQKQTFRCAAVMSALPPKADIGMRQLDVR